MIKKLIVAVVVVVFMSLLVSGCTTTSNTSPPPSQAPAQHNALIERLLADRRATISEHGYTIKVWNVSWKNSTTADLELAGQNETTNQTISSRAEVLVFPSTEAATSYVNTQNDGYSIASTVYPSDGAYERATGHPPSVYKEYEKNTGQTPLNLTSYYLYQLDNVVITENK